MARSHNGATVEALAGILRGESVLGLSEEQLLERFVARRDEPAFAALMARYGPLVMGVCRRSLDDDDEAEDAFQATFLVLVRRAGDIRRADRLGPWLFSVARKVTARARQQARNRKPSPVETEHLADPSAGAEAPAERSELKAIVDDEVAALPDTLRRPVVLCYLDGLTHDEAALRLRWPVGTVRSRLARARSVLKTRLARRGIVAGASALAFILAPRPVSASLIERTVRACLAFSSGPLATKAAGAATASLLASGVLRAMTFSKWITLTTSTLALGGTATISSLLIASGPQEGKEGPKAANASPEPGQVRPSATPIDTSREANARIRKALATKVELPLEELTLEDLFKWLQKTTKSESLPKGVPIYFDPVGLNEAKVTPASKLNPVWVQPNLDANLRSTLRLAGLSYTIQDGHMIISSVASIIERRLDGLEEKLNGLAAGGQEKDLREVQGAIEDLRTVPGQVKPSTTPIDTSRLERDRGQNGRPNPASLSVDEGRVRSVAFSPDGKTLAAGYMGLAHVGGGVAFWDVVTANRLHPEPITVSEGFVQSVAFSPDGKTLAGAYSRTDSNATSSGEGVLLWDVATHKRFLDTPLTVRGGHIESVAFSPDGKILAAGYSDRVGVIYGGVVLWDVITRKRVLDETLEVNGSISVAFSPDGRTLAVGYRKSLGSVRSQVELWDTVTHKRILDEPMTVAEGDVDAIAFSHDGRIVAAGYRADLAGGVVLWDVARRKRLGEAPLVLREGYVLSVTFSPDDKTLAAGYAGEGGGVAVWDVATRKRSLNDTIAANKLIIESVAFSPDGKTLAAGYPGVGSPVRGGGRVLLLPVGPREALREQSIPVTAPGNIAEKQASAARETDRPVQTVNGVVYLVSPDGRRIMAQDPQTKAFHTATIGKPGVDPPIRTQIVPLKQAPMVGFTMEGKGIDKLLLGWNGSFRAYDLPKPIDGTVIAEPISANILAILYRSDRQIYLGTSIDSNANLRWRTHELPAELGDYRDADSDGAVYRFNCRKGYLEYDVARDKFTSYTFDDLWKQAEETAKNQTKDAGKAAQSIRESEPTVETIQDVLYVISADGRKIVANHAGSGAIQSVTIGKPGQDPPIRTRIIHVFGGRFLGFRMEGQGIDKLVVGAYGKLVALPLQQPVEGVVAVEEVKGGNSQSLYYLLGRRLYLGTYVEKAPREENGFEWVSHDVPESLGLLQSAEVVSTNFSLDPRPGQMMSVTKKLLQFRCRKGVLNYDPYEKKWTTLDFNAILNEPSAPLEKPVGKAEVPITPAMEKPKADDGSGAPGTPQTKATPKDATARPGPKAERVGAYDCIISADGRKIVIQDPATGKSASTTIGRPGVDPPLKTQLVRGMGSVHTFFMRGKNIDKLVVLQGLRFVEHPLPKPFEGRVDNQLGSNAPDILIFRVGQTVYFTYPGKADGVPGLKFASAVQPESLGPMEDSVVLIKDPKDFQRIESVRLNFEKGRMEFNIRDEAWKTTNYQAVLNGTK